MGAFDDLPATDADIAAASVGDYAVLTPKAERLADGEDGSVAAYTLTSASFDFEARGVGPGHVLIVRRVPKSVSAGGSTRTALEEVNDVLAVASASGHSVTLARLDYPAGEGAYPSGAGSSGITFAVRSVRAQIRSAAADAARRLGIADLANPDLKLVTTLMVLRDLYFIEYRQVDADTFRSKMADMERRIADQFAVLLQTYGASEPANRRPKVGDMDPLRCPVRVPGDGYPASWDRWGWRP